ncbi:MerC domain-containing protein [Seonamhaeicola algicola]|uniref:MerC domain-containing protein n=1 Tax=Seonamhaeicola algicola TaxID=1719036 RepID=A0A5C7AW71_9FLAO|nr:MerC domain-containing protein [Seonamhaeicola algicola]TXE11819.1 MerC domain-containing protein [Seonamhaeicola algicola]
MKIAIKKPDTLGALASTLCLIHCLLTPFIFLAQTKVAACCATNGVPNWWKSIDFIFLIISFFAVYQSAKNSTKKTVKMALWFCWSLLCFLIINEKLAWFHLPEILIYLTAISMVILHVYNLKYCQCKTDNCCTNNE